VKSPEEFPKRKVDACASPYFNNLPHKQIKRSSDEIIQGSMDNATSTFGDQQRKVAQELRIEETMGINSQV
jgi:hypothetical protein